MSKRPGLAVLSALSVILSVEAAFSGELTGRFIEALEKKDRDKAAAIVVENKATVPGEIKTLLDGATGTEEETGAALFVAEEMATVYREATGDTGPLLAVKRKAFETSLSAPVRPALTGGNYLVELPKATDHEKNRFRPDNIIIKKGSTVKWVNNDSIAHVFSSMPLIGKGGIFTPSIGPGQSWSYTFTQPGEYYYICFIHKGMTGKVTVEE